MIYLKDAELDECKSLREVLYSKQLNSILTKQDLDFAIEKFKIYCVKLGINWTKYTLDMKCGIIWTEEEMKKGIKNLHNHG